MPSEANMISSLEAIAAGTGDGFFIVERTHEVGEPVLWRERSSYQLGGEQHTLSLRSQFDTGGYRIGQWRAPAEPERAQAFARALVSTNALAARSESILPGQGRVRWTYATSAGYRTFALTDSSPALSAMASVDDAFEAMERALEASRAGAALVCELELYESEGQRIGMVTLVNQGGHDALVANPLTAPSMGGQSYVRLEVCELPEEVAGVTSPEPEFRPLTAPEVPLAGGWEDRFLVFRPGSRLRLPVHFPISGPASPRHYVRAVYSTYGAPETLGGMLVIAGRAFSKEVQLAPG